MSDGEKFGILLFVMAIIFLVAHGQKDCNSPTAALYVSLVALTAGTVTFMASGKK